MKLDSHGILISLRPLGERDSVAHIFTYDYGIMCGVMRGGAVARKNKPLVGQVGCATWVARLDSQLGTFHWDAEKNLGAAIMMNPGALLCMNAAFEILTTLLPERESYMDLYDETLNMIENLGVGVQNTYLIWEINLLRDLGYALDLSKCSGCGVVENLNFLSPRTGRAVCDKCAAPYINKLYKLPVNLDTTLRFLENICVQQGVDVPAVRRMIKNI